MKKTNNIYYWGIRTENGCDVFKGQEGSSDKNILPSRLELFNHSPTGFEWGYLGSGPAQLALAILAEHLPLEQAIVYHQTFKNEVISTLSYKEWKLEAGEVELWLKKHTKA